MDQNRILEPDLNFKNFSTFEPFYTSINNHFFGTVDYIWYFFIYKPVYVFIII